MEILQVKLNLSQRMRDLDKKRRRTTMRSTHGSLRFSHRNCRHSLSLPQFD